MFAVLELYNVMDVASMSCLPCLLLVFVRMHLLALFPWGELTCVVSRHVHRYETNFWQFQSSSVISGCLVQCASPIVDTHHPSWACITIMPGRPSRPSRSCTGKEGRRRGGRPFRSSGGRSGYRPWGRPCGNWHRSSR